MPTVSVLIAAHDCAPTVGRAIASALAQPETQEVVVVDDASGDGTRACVAGWAARDGRVRLIPLDVNTGPASARNRAMQEAGGDVFALLDSDDFFAPGRLARLLAEPGWDMCADNIAFVTEQGAENLDFSALPGVGDDFETINAATFCRGNLASSGHTRGEMGFLKPLLSRAFLRRHDLWYDETLRLGEDYDLYVRLLLAGARFRVTRQAGYGAVTRATSLSARHATADLAALDTAIARHEVGATGEAAVAMRAYRAEVRAKLDHRNFLDRKARDGLISAVKWAFAGGGNPARILRGIARDKLRPLGRDRDQPDDAGYRLLLPLEG